MQGIHQKRDRSTMSALLVVLVALIAAVIVLKYRSRGPDGTRHQAVGSNLPGMRLTPLTGDTGGPMALDAFRGKVTLVNFWGTWCPPCRKEFPHLIALRDQFSTKPQFQFVSVSCGGGNVIANGFKEPVEDLRASTLNFLNRADVELDTMVDTTGSSRRALSSLPGVDGFAYPTTVLVDQELIVRGYWVGYAPGVELVIEAEIKRLLENVSQAAI